MYKGDDLGGGTRPDGPPASMPPPPPFPAVHPPPPPHGCPDAALQPEERLASGMTPCADAQPVALQQASAPLAWRSCLTARGANLATKPRKQHPHPRNAPAQRCAAAIDFFAGGRLCGNILYLRLLLAGPPSNSPANTHYFFVQVSLGH